MADPEGWRPGDLSKKTIWD
ncbi:uncharacterized protein G2W53_001397 [Senna tora]|uniref:Uncharacterized protein n=1 Tax=Senna tora TaxID=362788 RepID=A0A834XHV2_9FABA|nr:uncharacterized protein G2W53_001397 [Senna tora]